MGVLRMPIPECTHSLLLGDCFERFPCKEFVCLYAKLLRGGGFLFLPCSRNHQHTQSDLRRTVNRPRGRTHRMPGRLQRLHLERRQRHPVENPNR